MFQVQCLDHKKKTPTDIYSKYSLGPFLKGQSTTIGNSLRRILLSNIKGIAVSGVRIIGINHEFSTIPNVKEDVIDILLNIKQICLKGVIDEPALARLSTTKPGLVTAKDIKLPPNIKCVDPRQYIATLAEAGNLEMEFIISSGSNYITNAGLKTPELPGGFLSLDSVFMPVKKVNFFVETSTQNYAVDYENLIFEIYTDGSILPDEALSSAAEILENIFNAIKVTEMSKLAQHDSLILAEDEQVNELENVFIEELELSVRAYNCLKRANVHTLSDLLKYSIDELLEFKNFGQKSADEVNDSLRKRFNQELRK